MWEFHLNCVIEWYAIRGRFHLKCLSNSISLFQCKAKRWHCLSKYCFNRGNSDSLEISRLKIENNSNIGNFESKQTFYLYIEVENKQHIKSINEVINYEFDTKTNAWTFQNKRKRKKSQTNEQINWKGASKGKINKLLYSHMQHLLCENRKTVPKK